MDIITGYKGEPHITEWQDRTGYAGIVGSGQYILPFGSLLPLSNPSGRVLRLGGGIICMNGLMACIREGEYDALAVDPVNTSGYSRIDLVVARYERNGTTGVESIKPYVIKGTEAASPTAPEHMAGSVTQNTVANTIDMPLYSVKVQYDETITITKIATVIEPLSSYAGVKNAVYENVVESPGAQRVTSLSVSGSDFKAATGVDVNKIRSGKYIVTFAGEKVASQADYRPIVNAYNVYPVLETTSSGNIQIWVYPVDATSDIYVRFLIERVGGNT